MKKIIKSFLCLLIIFAWVDSPYASKVSAEAIPPTHIENMAGLFETKSGSQSSVTSDGVVNVTPNAGNTIGAIWSTENNLLDFKKSFRLTNYLYFGPASTKVGDGMAMVFQSSGTATPQWFSYNVSSLGYLGDQRTASSLGIPNSLAIEFDLFNNQSDGDGWFDKSTPAINQGQHIAYTWPGNADEYTNWQTFFTTQRSIVHHDLISYLLNNNKWIKLDINWNAKTQQFQYIIDDTNVVNVPYDNLYNNVLSHGTDVYWGFTGATGTYCAPQKVVFQKISSLIEAEAKVNLFNITRNKPVASGDEVHVNEKLNVNYSLEYLDGKQNWTNISMTLNAPPDIVLDPGTITLTPWYKDKKGESVTLPDSMFSNGVIEIPNSGDDTLGLEGDVPSKVDVSYQGYINENTTAEQMIFNSDNVGDNAYFQSENMVIVPKKNIAPALYFDNYQNWNVSDMDITKNISGTLQDANKSRLTLTYTLDDQELGSEIVDTSETGDGVWEFTLAKEDINALNAGTHVFRVTATNLVGQSTIIEGKLIKWAAPVIDNLQLLNSSETILKGSDASFRVNWHDTDSEKAQFFYKLDGAAPVLIAEKNNSNLGGLQSFDWSLNTADLSVGLHQIEIYAVDSEQNTSKMSTLNFTVDGQLTMHETPKDFSLQAEIPKTRAAVKVTDIGAISVTDNRLKKSTWHLQAKYLPPETFYYQASTGEKKRD